MNARMMRNLTTVIYMLYFQETKKRILMKTLLINLKKNSKIKFQLTAWLKILKVIDDPQEISDH